ncbi:molybdopterin-dependent oxidoreductase, partial [bacterium]|nr:molybdopterin-dependent oxidoreductase [bacterium]
MLIKKKRGWELPESRVISESRYFNRRQIVKALGLGTIGAGTASIWTGCVDDETIKNPIEIAPPFDEDVPAEIRAYYPADPNPDFAEVPPGREMTPEDIAATYNNFYEFGIDKTKVHIYARSLVTRPWEVEITGLCRNPRTMDPDDFYAEFGIEERIYRHRCVERWSMVVPWVGFPLRKLVELADPTSDARFVQFTSFYEPSQAVGQQTLTQYN